MNLQLTAVDPKLDQYMAERAQNCVDSIEASVVAKNIKVNETEHEPESLQESKETINDGFLTVFLTTFTTVFIAEIGDKTQLATLLLSAQSGRPLIVFLGAALALISASLVGVLVGRWLSTVVSPEKFQQISGLLFIVLGVWLATQAFESMLGTI